MLAKLLCLRVSKKYNVSNKIPLPLLVKAYEIWITTDLTQRQVAKALGVHHRTLNQAIVTAERRGLYGTYKPAFGIKIVQRFIETNQSKLTTREISEHLNLGLDVTKQACYKLHKEKLIKRRKLEGATPITYLYYSRDHEKAET